MKDFFEAIGTTVKYLLDVCVVIFLSFHCVEHWTYHTLDEISDMNNFGVLLITLWCAYRVGYAIGMTGIMLVLYAIGSRRRKKREAFHKKMMEITL